MTPLNAIEGDVIYTPNGVIESPFDSFKELKHTLDYIALTESLFGSSELSPLSTPGMSPQPSPILRATMDIDGGGGRCLDDLHNPPPLDIETPFQASSSSQPMHTHQTHSLNPEIPTRAPSSAPPTDATGAERQKAKKKAQSHANRKKSRQMAREGAYANIKVRPECTAKFVNSSTPISTESETKNASRVSTGYTGRDDGGCSSKLYTLDELIGEESKFGFQLQKWNGK